MDCASEGAIVVVRRGGGGEEDKLGVSPSPPLPPPPPPAEEPPVLSSVTTPAAAPEVPNSCRISPRASQSSLSYSSTTIRDWMKFYVNSRRRECNSE